MRSISRDYDYDHIRFWFKPLAPSGSQFAPTKTPLPMVPLNLRKIGNKSDDYVHFHWGTGHRRLDGAISTKTLRCNRPSAVAGASW